MNKTNGEELRFLPIFLSPLPAELSSVKVAYTARGGGHLGGGHALGLLSENVMYVAIYVHENASSPIKAIHTRMLGTGRVATPNATHVTMMAMLMAANAEVSARAPLASLRTDSVCMFNSCVGYV
ncbi:hypothetical protein HMPREF0183_1155 [Brevibacterium mcbrellneri ATCC 49030]|uniref:Uncharacterized protein n=1 Tax=Brevibacterium mcbrellneri ATCC 49030 TaxID=585530 RepID=D4YMJ5_9MICO|nr:hypothetical protein HMPREF0183_1155 [Brevibacterium mcbrellneri ATCC 49030]